MGQEMRKEPCKPYFCYCSSIDIGYHVAIVIIYDTFHIIEDLLGGRESLEIRDKEEGFGVFVVSLLRSLDGRELPCKPYR